MGIFEINLSALEKNENEIYKRMTQMEFDSAIVKTLVAKDGSKVQLFQDQIRMNSLYSPEHEAACFAMNYQEDEKTVFLVSGFAGGYFIRELLKGNDNQRKMVVYESNKDLFFHTMHVMDISDLLSNPNMFLVVKGINDFELPRKIVQLICSTDDSKTVLIQLPQYEKIAPEGCQELEESWKEQSYLLQVNDNTKKRFKDSMFQNQLHHFQYLKDQFLITDLKGKWPENLPIIIVGAGPSLDQSMEVLKKAKGKIPILCMDSALKSLKNCGLRPDFYISVEPDKPLDLFDAAWLAGIPLFTTLESTTELLDQDIFPGKKIFCKDSKFIEQFYQHLGLTIPQWESGGNVGTSAFTAAVEMGVKTIILVGHDHAYSVDGNAHTNGRPEKYREAFCENDRYIVPGVKETYVQSRYDWMIYLNWYANSIPFLEDENVTVINATEGGARIKGTKECKLTEVLETYSDCSFSVEEFMSCIHTSFDESMMEKVYQAEKDLNLQMSQTMQLIEKTITIAKAVVWELYKKQAITETAILQSQKLVECEKKIFNTLIYPLLEQCRTIYDTNTNDVKYHSNHGEVEKYLSLYQKSQKKYEALKKSLEFIQQ